MQVHITIEGLDEVVQRLDARRIGPPMRRFFETAAVTVQTEARPNAPVDTGQLRNAIVYAVDSSEIPLWADVGILGGEAGSGLWFKARAMEFGTGRMGDAAVSHQGGHWPPGEALDTWARRHGFESGWQVATIIGRRGGLRPRPFLRPAFERAQGKISGLLDRLAREIAEQL